MPQQPKRPYKPTKLPNLSTLKRQPNLKAKTAPFKSKTSTSKTSTSKTSTPSAPKKKSFNPNLPLPIKVIAPALLLFVGVGIWQLSNWRWVSFFDLPAPPPPAGPGLVPVTIRNAAPDTMHAVIVSADGSQKYQVTFEPCRTCKTYLGEIDMPQTCPVASIGKTFGLLPGSYTVDVTFGRSLTYTNELIVSGDPGPNPGPCFYAVKYRGTGSPPIHF